VKKKRLTFAEYLAAEEADPERRAQRRAREEADRQWLAIRMAEVRREEAPIVADLQTNGVSVSQVSDLVNTAEPYPDAIPILWKHFLLSYSDRTKESIGRALAVREKRAILGRTSWRSIEAIDTANPQKRVWPSHSTCLQRRIASTRLSSLQETNP